MTSKLVPPNPDDVTVIREIVPGTIITSSTPFLRFGLIKIGGRGTIVRMQNGSLAVFSPTALTDELKEKVARMGEIRYITALDYEHHIFLGPWHKEYPHAKVLGPEGLVEKRKTQGNESVPFAVTFSVDRKHETMVDPEFDAEFQHEYVHAHANKEIVFNHKPTRTLIQADLIFNLPATEQYNRAGVDARAGMLTRLFSLFANLRAFNESVARINAWDFERIIPCHGDVIENDGKTAFQRLMKWHIDAALKKQ